MTAAFSSTDPSPCRTEDSRLCRLGAVAFPRRRTEQLRNSVTHGVTVPLICSALGVPREDWALFSRWTDELTRPTSDGTFRSALYDVYAYVDVMVADRCRSLKDDLLSDLIMVQVDGDELDSDELRRLVAGALMCLERSCLGAHLAKI